MTLAILIYLTVGACAGVRVACTQYTFTPLERLLLVTGVAILWPVVVAVELPQELRELRYQRELQKKFGGPS